MSFSSVRAWFSSLQKKLVHALEQLENCEIFFHDMWTSTLGQGTTCVLKQGEVFAQAGVNFSQVQGKNLPSTATQHRPELAGWHFEATGVSLVVHPRNPYVPTSHANVRFFAAKNPDDENHLVWWFGGGFDLTPYYPFDEDIIHWHQTAQAICTPFGGDVYPKYKKWCDDYFYLKHRQETRGVGGLFFDDLSEWGFERCFDFAKAVGCGYLDAYLPIVERRKAIPWGEQEEAFQQLRRGRYVEFNLVYDRGTTFGLQSGGRTDSILMSLPPSARWEYAWQPDEGSQESHLAAYLKPRDWLKDLSI